MVALNPGDPRPNTIVALNVFGSRQCASNDEKVLVLHVDSF
jgi:hypothetical protein